MFGIDFVDFFPSLVFLDYISPFNICCKAVWVVLSSLNFCLSEKLFISPSILNEIVSGYNNLGYIFPFQYFKCILPFLIACRVSAQISAVKLLDFPCIFSSVAQSCPSLCDPMDCSMPGIPVHHQLPEFTQTHVHRVGDAIQPSHPLSSPSPPAPKAMVFPVVMYGCESWTIKKAEC